jgi:hypothetical protein
VLVRVTDDGALAIGQLSHAWLSGQLARAWGNERFPAAEPREEIALGAEQHDIGWALFDRNPPFNPATGLPLNFLDLTVEQHLSIWRKAPDRLMSQSLHAALVVSLHGRSLSLLRASALAEPPAALLAHADGERARQQRLCALLGLAGERAQLVQRQMWTWDALSLALCNAWRPFSVKDVPAVEGPVDIELRDRGDGRAVVEPWPFSSRHVQVRCEARRLQASYRDQAAMRRGFQRAAPVTLTFALAAP